MDPPEVDKLSEVLQGRVPGIWNAAKRKLLHELGIAVPDDWQFHYVRRVRYWAADTVTHGPDSPWGEHETDYLLLVTVPDRSVVDSLLQPNPEEVQATRWVTATELQDMMNDTSLLFSPWFRIIAEQWLLPTWWKDLPASMQGKFDDWTTIAAFDPPEEHVGGAGNAQKLFARTSSEAISTNVNSAHEITTRYVACAVSYLLYMYCE
jgi:hypothetical protein